MDVAISEIKLFRGNNGIGMRCSITLSDRHPEAGLLSWTTRGCLVMRDPKTKKLNLLPPVTYINNGRFGTKQVRYRPNVANENLTNWVCEKLEETYGKHIKLFDKKKQAPAEIEPSDLEPGLGDEMTI